MGKFVQSYLLNPATYVCETCTVGCRFIMICKSIVIPPSNMELWAMLSPCFVILLHMGKFEWLYLLNPYGHGTCTVGHKFMKIVFKHGDVFSVFGAVNSWSTPCFMVLYALVILCDHISWALQCMDMELVLWDTARIEIYMGVLKYCDIHVRFGTETPWNQSRFVVLACMHW